MSGNVQRQKMTETIYLCVPFPNMEGEELRTITGQLTSSWGHGGQNVPKQLGGKVGSFVESPFILCSEHKF